jgi:glycerophosphoryl diester phosphodiesterase
MKQWVIILIISFLAVACRKHYDVQMPDIGWDLFSSPGLLPLNTSIRINTEGVYELEKGSKDFGNTAALKWTYNAINGDTTFYLSFFCAGNVSYFICEGKRSDTNILLNGYWRKMANTETGKIRLTISGPEGAYNLIKELGNGQGNIIIKGVYGSNNQNPDQPIQLKYLRPLFHRSPLEMVVHRGGGQTADLLPASENSKEIIQWASRFGATGIEVDVRLTKDSVPVLYHDVSLSERLIRKNGLVGPIENYTYAQLNSLVQLIRNGEHIPTLREALQTMVYNTPLRYIWLDTKFHAPLQQIRNLQEEYLQKAASIGRTVEITIGIPDQTVLSYFMKLPDYRNIPSVCELDPIYVEEANSRIWGPRWTLGLQNEQVDQIHAKGKRAFVWTLDIPENIQTYMAQGHFDGILTDYPSALAYYYYVQQ